MQSRLRAVPENAIRDGVPVAPADAVPGQVTRGFQVGHDALDGPLGQADGGADVAHPRLRVAGNLHQHVPVPGQQRPAAILSVSELTTAILTSCSRGRETLIAKLISRNC
jgi:hypothetical protein